MDPLRSHSNYISPVLSVDFLNPGRLAGSEGGNKLAVDTYSDKYDNHDYYIDDLFPNLQLNVYGLAERIWAGMKLKFVEHAFERISRLRQPSVAAAEWVLPPSRCSCNEIGR
jgi:hypothetical protein